MVVPLSLSLLLIFRRAARSYAVHLVFSLHFYTFMLLLFCVPAIAIAAETALGGAVLRSQLADDIISLSLLAACAGYLYLAVGTVYHTHGVSRGLQTVALLCAVIVVLFCYRLFLLTFTSHYVFVDVDAKCFVDLLCDPWAAKPWVALFQLNDGLDEFG